MTTTRRKRVKKRKTQKERNNFYIIPIIPKKALMYTLIKIQKILFILNILQLMMLKTR